VSSIQRIDRPKPWRARYDGPDGREHSRSFRRKVDAEQWLRVQLGAMDQGTWSDPRAGALTIGEWAEHWLQGLHSIGPKTRLGYESLLKSRILPAFGAWKLRAIGPADVRRWQAEMLADGLSSARVRQARQVLGAMLGQATTDGLITRNPVPLVRGPKVEARRQMFLTAAELDRLADAADAVRIGSGALVAFLGWSGVRWGEAIALTSDKVDIERRRVRISAAYTEVGGRLVLGPTKTHENRTVVVPRQILERLPTESPDRVFNAAKGGILRITTFRRTVWQPATSAAGFDGLMIHDLRDTAASLMISSGASIKAVQRNLGHASAKMTLDIYGGLFEDDLDRLSDRMEALYEANDTSTVIPLRGARGGAKGGSP
jgi:integrase